MSESSLFVVCPANVSDSAAGGGNRLPCILPYGHIEPRDHLTASGEVFSFESGIDAVRDPESSDETSSDEGSDDDVFYA